MVNLKPAVPFIRMKATRQLTFFSETLLAIELKKNSNIHEQTSLFRSAIVRN